MSPNGGPALGTNPLSIFVSIKTTIFIGEENGEGKGGGAGVGSREQAACKKQSPWGTSHTTASMINARKMNARYMLDQRYIFQATLLPGMRHTRHAATISIAPSTMADTR